MKLRIFHALIFINSELLNGDMCYVGILSTSDFSEFVCVYTRLGELFKISVKSL
jgi:hypothetical protein